MNNLLSFWLAPVTALFSPRVYRDAVKSSGGRGILYVLYLSLITVVVVMMFLVGKVVPVTDDLVSWTRKNMSVMIWTPEGISLEDGKMTATLEHPQYGLIAKVDLSKTNVTEADMGNGFFFVTAKRIFVKRGPGQIESHDITKTGIRTSEQLPPRIRITGDIVWQLYQNLKNTLAVIFPAVLFVIFSLMLLLGNAFYSLAGLFLNRRRKQKLEYGAIFTLTCFATTASFTLTWLRIMTPLQALPWSFVVDILINLAYLFFAFKMTDQAME